MGVTNICMGQHRCACRGQALEALGRWDEALQIYSKYARKYPRDEFFRKAVERAGRHAAGAAAAAATVAAAAGSAATATQVR